MIFANIMSDNKKIVSYKNKLLQKYKLVILNSESFEERGSFSFSVLRFCFFVFCFVLFFLAVSFVLITQTPLNSYIPGKSSSEVQKALIDLSLRSDSLEKTLKNQSVYFENIENIILGKNVFQKTASFDTLPLQKQKSLDFNISEEDSLLRVSVERDNTGSFVVGSKPNNEYLTFFPPVYGIISDKYNSREKHFGIDLVAKETTRISSVLDGTVIVSSWTPETGYIIALQHKNDFISIYKHNSLLIKSVGDFVKAGEHIAIIGNSGELSSGPHLHFELWHKGQAVDPENYISF